MKFPKNNIGWFSLFFLFVSPLFVKSQTTYYWAGGVSGNISIATNWSSTLGGGGTNPTSMTSTLSGTATNSIRNSFVIDGSNLGGGTTGTLNLVSSGGSSAILGQLVLTNGAAVVFSFESTPPLLIGSTSASNPISGEDLQICATCSLTLASGSSPTVGTGIKLQNQPSANIADKNTFNNSGTLVIETGTIFSLEQQGVAAGSEVVHRNSGKIVVAGSFSNQSLNFVTLSNTGTLEIVGNAPFTFSSQGSRVVHSGNARLVYSGGGSTSKLAGAERGDGSAPVIPDGMIIQISNTAGVNLGTIAIGQGTGGVLEIIGNGSVIGTTAISWGANSKLIYSGNERKNLIGSEWSTNILNLNVQIANTAGVRDNNSRTLAASGIVTIDAGCTYIRDGGTLTNNGIINNNGTIELRETSAIIGNIPVYAKGSTLLFTGFIANSGVDECPDVVGDGVTIRISNSGGITLGAKTFASGSKLEILNNGLVSPVAQTLVYQPGSQLVYLGRIQKNPISSAEWPDNATDLSVVIGNSAGVTMTRNFTLSNKSTLVIADTAMLLVNSNITLTNNGIITNNGTLQINGTGLVSGNPPVLNPNSTLWYSGTNNKPSVPECPAVIPDKVTIRISNVSGVILGNRTFAAGSRLVILDNGYVAGSTPPTYQEGSRLIFSGATIKFISVSSIEWPSGNIGIPAGVTVEINNSGGVTLNSGSPRAVTGTLLLTRGTLTLGSENLTINQKAGIQGGSLNSHIITNGNGKLLHALSGPGTVTLPFGTGIAYNPATLSWTGNPGISRLDARFIYNAAATPTGIPFNNGSLNINSLLNNGYWEITPGAGTLSGNFDISLTHNGHTNAGSKLNMHAIIRRNNSTSKWFGAGIWVDPGDTPITPANSGQVAISQTGVSELGLFSIGIGSLCSNPAPGSINVSETSGVAENDGMILSGDTVTLSITGKLNDGTTWEWYSGNCGGASAGKGASVKLTPSVTTNYFLRGTGGCVIPDSCISFLVKVDNKPTALSELDQQGSVFSIYPNPASDILNFKFKPGFVPQNMQILDLMGRVVESFSTTTLHIGHLPKGTYLVVIGSVDGLSVRPLIINQ